MGELLDPDHDSLKHVRDMTIVAFGNNDEVLNAAELETIVRNIKYLTSFRYSPPPEVSFSNRCFSLLNRIQVRLH